MGQKYLAFMEKGKIRVTKISRVRVLSFDYSIEDQIRKKFPDGKGYLLLEKSEFPDEKYREIWKFNQDQTALTFDDKTALTIARKRAFDALKIFQRKYLRESWNYSRPMTKKEKKEFERYKSQIRSFTNRRAMEQFTEAIKATTKSIPYK